MNLLHFLTQDATLSMPVGTYNALLEKAVNDERERIIKLLENATDHACPECLDRAVDDAIALIKGENK